jgi:poly-gamma-glutamate synthesis protein (capsule biosynthesis protein)
MRIIPAIGIVTVVLLVPLQAESRPDTALRPRAERSASAARAQFRGEVLRIDRDLRNRMVGSSWHRGCPVALADLRLLKLRHRGFDGSVRTGFMVVHETAARRVLRVFRRLFNVGFRIRRMRLVDAYGADDHRSMNADNTSAFNCREVAGRPGVWSRHAFGRAIDINPIENPYVSGGHVSPPRGRPFADRKPRRKGMIGPNTVVVRYFAAVGWEWGGFWSGEKDYQHFSASGR